MSARRVETPAPGLSGDPGFLLARAGARAIRSFNRALDDVGLRSRLYSVLMAVEEQEGLSQRALSAVLDVDPSAVVAIVDELQDAGLVRRDAHPADRRSHVVVITDGGRTLIERIRPTVDRIHDEILASLKPDERQLFVEMLKRVAGVNGA